MPTEIFISFTCNLGRLCIIKILLNKYVFSLDHKKPAKLPQAAY